MSEKVRELINAYHIVAKELAQSLARDCRDITRECPKKSRFSKVCPNTRRGTRCEDVSDVDWMYAIIEDLDEYTGIDTLNGGRE